jgi:peptidoglycan/xylan/chitin deacetylase (PgdA/CDA1 family)
LTIKHRLDFLLIAFILICLLDITATAADSAVVLMYHRFGEDRYPETNIEIEQFEAQLDLLKREGFTVLPLSRLLAALRHKTSLPPGAVVITIDDAYRSIYDTAYPRLREYGFPFTVFVSTDPIDDGFPAYMTWEQMREMASGGASFANHGASHLSMIERLRGESNQERLARVLVDVEKGRKRLEGELEPVPNVFAYPYGEFDSLIAEQLQKMGYICFGQHSGAVGTGSDPRALPRFAIAEAFADISEFRIKVRSLPLAVDALDPWEPVVNENTPQIDVTLGESKARLSELACFVSGQGRTPIHWIDEGKRFSVVPQSPLESGRQRINCTAPLNDGRYLWFSHPWFVKMSDP